jgi:Bacterial transcriptional activator domain
LPSSSSRSVRSAVAELRHGNRRTVIGELEALVAMDPTRERSWCLLVSALAGEGRQADALNAVARARRALALELGVEPGPQLRELEQAVLDHCRPPCPPRTTAPNNHQQTPLVAPDRHGRVPMTRAIGTVGGRVGGWRREEARAFRRHVRSRAPRSGDGSLRRTRPRAGPNSLRQARRGTNVVRTQRPRRPRQDRRPHQPSTTGWIAASGDTDTEVSASRASAHRRRTHHLLLQDQVARPWSPCGDPRQSPRRARRPMQPARRRSGRLERHTNPSPACRLPVPVHHR